MKLEDQVVSLELAKRLKELGVKQESHFVWLPAIGYVDEKPVDEDEQIVERTVLSSKDEDWKLSCDASEEARPGMVAAFTVAELGEMLPFRKKNLGTVNDALLAVLKMPQGWRVVYFDEDKDVYDGIVADSGYEPNEADARAKMMVYLLENRLVELPQ